MKNTHNNSRMAVLAFSFVLSVALPIAVFAAGPSPVNLLSAGNFAVLTKAGISTTGSTLVTGDIGVSPINSTAITGFGLNLPVASPFATSSLVTGKVYAPDYANPTPATLTAAVSDMQTAYTDGAGRTNPTATELGAGNIGGLTISPGLYKWGTAVTIPSDVTLSGGPNDVWIFQVAQTLTVSSGAKVILAGGAQASNVFWIVAGQTTIGTTAVFNGNILDQTAIVLNTGATLDGRALAQTAVTLDSNAVSMPVFSTPSNVTITPVNTSAIADGTFADGWNYVFNITIPTNEPHLSMSFGNWTDALDNGTIPAANNIEISSLQADNSNVPIVITAANVLSSPALNMVTDLDPNTPGMQVQVTVKTAVPLNSVNGLYTTNYAIQTLP